eukprot:6182253-Pleurochrysis_carterae.AAC.3
MSAKDTSNQHGQAGVSFPRAAFSVVRVCVTISFEAFRLFQAMLNADSPFLGSRAPWQLLLPFTAWRVCALGNVPSLSAEHSAQNCV